GRQNTDQDKKELGPWIKPKPFLPALTAHAVIPAFSNCFFNILQPTKALIAEVIIAAANMAIRMPVLAVACMVSIEPCSVPFPSMVCAQPFGSAKKTIYDPVPPRENSMYARLFSFLFLYCPAPATKSATIAIIR